MKEIVILMGQEGQEAPPEYARINQIAYSGAVSMWFIASDSAVEVFQHVMRAAVATSVGASITPIGSTDRPRRVILAVPQAELRDLEKIAEIAVRICKENEWEHPQTAMFAVVNLPSAAHLDTLDNFTAQILPSVVFLYEPRAIAPTVDDAMALTEWFQRYARRHETAVVMCFAVDEAFFESIQT